MGHSLAGTCSCCGDECEVHVETSGIVHSCGHCKLVIRYAGQVIRAPEADHVAEKPVAAIELGLMSKKEFAALHGPKKGDKKDTTPANELNPAKVKATVHVE